jgi:hypothetical protein
MIEDKFIEKVVEIDLEEIIDCNRDQFLDLLSEVVFDAVYPCLMDIHYEIIGFKSPHIIIMHVDGVYEPEEDECEVCDNILKDGETCICENGHRFCVKHLVNTDDPGFEEEDNMDDVPSKYCPICDEIQTEKDMKRCSD